VHFYQRRVRRSFAEKRGSGPRDYKSGGKDPTGENLYGKRRVEWANAGKNQAKGGGHQRRVGKNFAMGRGGWVLSRHGGHQIFCHKGKMANDEGTVGGKRGGKALEKQEGSYTMSLERRRGSMGGRAEEAQAAPWLWKIEKKWENKKAFICVEMGYGRYKIRKKSRPVGGSRQGRKGKEGNKRFQREEGVGHSTQRRRGNVQE